MNEGETTMLLRYIYTFFLGILIAIFVGMGVSVFYESPEAPKMPDIVMYGKEQPTQAEQQQQIDWDKQMEEFNKTVMSNYNRNVSMITLVIAVGLLAIGLIFADKIKVLADGILLGGVFTLIYSLGRGIASSDSKYRFAIVSVSLIITLALGYLKFIRPHELQAEKATVKKK